MKLIFKVIFAAAHVIITCANVSYRRTHPDMGLLRARAPQFILYTHKTHPTTYFLAIGDRRVCVYGAVNVNEEAETQKHTIHTIAARVQISQQNIK